MIGDYDPEDGYDAGDPIVDRLALLVRVVDAIRDDPDDARRYARRVDVLRVLAAVAAELATATHHVTALTRQVEDMG